MLGTDAGEEEIGRLREQSRCCDGLPKNRRNFLVRKLVVGRIKQHDASAAGRRGTLAGPLALVGYRLPGMESWLRTLRTRRRSRANIFGSARRAPQARSRPCEMKTGSRIPVSPDGGALRRSMRCGG